MLDFSQTCCILMREKMKSKEFSNMKKIIKHYPMTDRLIVRRGYRRMLVQHPLIVWKYRFSPTRVNICLALSLDHLISLQFVPLFVMWVNIDKIEKFMAPSNWWFHDCKAGEIIYC